MKKSILLTVLLFGLIIQKSNAQSTTASNNFAPGDFLGYNALFPGTLTFATAGPIQMTLTPAGDLNINGAANGYQIGGNHVLWYDGDQSNIYVGVGSAVHVASVTGLDNTFVGFNSGAFSTGGTGIENVAVGYSAGFSLTNAAANNNTFSGYETGYNMNTGFNNSDYGYQAGYHDINGAFNTFLGENAGYNTQGCNGTCNLAGDYNVMSGDRSGYNNNSGRHNCYYGAEASYNNTTGNLNCIYGAISGWTGGGYDSNAYYGAESAFKNSGNSNVMMGIQAGYNTGSSGGSATYNTFVGPYGAYYNPSGIYNVTLGYRADAYTGTQIAPGPINNSVAIGASAVVNKNNSIILGNNDQWTGIGLSYNGLYGFPNNSLEICSRTQTGTLIANSSGLRFTNLNANSPTVPNQGNMGVLALSTAGDVIYVPAPAGGGTGIGYCNALTSMTSDGGYDLNAHNLYFAGNHSFGLNQNDVLIGYPCNTSPVLAKLSILQQSLAPFSATQSTMGLYVENDDLMTNGTNTIGQPVIGIKSWIPNPSSNCTSIAGWFEADGSPSICAGNYALIVPPGGGYTGLGTVTPTATLNVLGDGIFDWDGITGGAALNGAAVTTGPVNTAISAEVRNATSHNYGVTSVANGPLGSMAYGMYTEAPGTDGSTWNYGIYAMAYGTQGSTFNYAVYGDAFNSSDPNTWAGYFNGRAYCTASAWTSDSILKDNVQPIPNAIGTLMQLAPRSFVFDTTKCPSLNLPRGTQYGLIAQAVKRVLPNLVCSVTQPPKLDSLGHVIDSAFTFCAMNYIGFIPFLISGVQQQQQSIDSLHHTIDSLRGGLDSLTKSFDSVRTLLLSYVNCLKNLCNNNPPNIHHDSRNESPGDSNNTTTNVQDITLSSADAPLLYQNIPNPFSSGTKINYYLPTGTAGATIVFYDNYGNQIKQVKLSETGNGTLNITPENLTNGIYSYSLVVNGSAVDTKRMVLQK